MREFKATGPAYQKQVHTRLRSSYGSHYRRMLSPLLEALEFRSNNAVHRPVIDALAFLKARRESKQRYFPPEEGVPIDGVVRSGWKEIVLEKDKNGVERINRINYEIAVLQALRDRLRCKEIWVVGADRYRNPDEDLPADFEAQAGAVLRGPRATPGRRRLRRRAADSRCAIPSTSWSADLPQEPQGPDHRAGEGTPLGLTPRTPARAGQPRDPEGGDHPALADDQPARRAQGDRPARRLHATSSGASSPREVLDREELQKRLLLCLYGLGTNTGLKRVSASDTGHQPTRTCSTSGAGSSGRTRCAAPSPGWSTPSSRPASPRSGARARPPAPPTPRSSGPGTRTS